MITSVLSYTYLQISFGLKYIKVNILKECTFFCVLLISIRIKVTSNLITNRVTCPYRTSVVSDQILTEKSARRFGKTIGHNYYPYRRTSMLEIKFTIVNLELKLYKRSR